MGNSAFGGNSSESAVQSVDRALTILKVLSDRGESGVTEIATELGIHKSTASRLLSSLVDHDLVEQVAERGKFRLGVGILRLAGNVSASLEPVAGSRAVTRLLAQDVEESVNICVLDGSDALYVDQVIGPNLSATKSWVGIRLPAHASATGKALTAWLDEDARKAARPKKWIKLMPRTIMSAEDLEKELALTRKRGYALAVEEYEPSLVGIAAPIRDAHGEVVATVAVSGPAHRITPDRYQDIARQVMDAALKLSGKADY